jgi:hypothetical protein
LPVRVGNGIAVVWVGVQPTHVPIRPNDDRAAVRVWVADAVGRVWAAVSAVWVVDRLGAVRTAVLAIRVADRVWIIRVVVQFAEVFAVRSVEAFGNGRQPLQRVVAVLSSRFPFCSDVRP